MKPGSGSNRIVRKRCPKCRRLRAFKFDANYDFGERKYWQSLTQGGPKVCHICVARANGDALPLTHGEPGKKRTLDTPPTTG